MSNGQIINVNHPRIRRDTGNVNIVQVKYQIQFNYHMYEDNPENNFMVVALLWTYIISSP
jgi:hypothetical protein